MRAITHVGVVLSLTTSALAVGSGYEAEIRAWREAREARLKADGGWLTVAGLHWLKEGANRFGTDRSLEIVLPEGSAPPRAGVFDVRGDKVRLRVEPGVVVTLAGQPVTERELATDRGGDPDVLSLGRLTLQVIERGGRLAVRLKDMESRARREFRGIEWFPVREAYRVQARFVPYAPPRKIPILNVLGQIESYESPGAVVFTLEGRELRLDPVFESPGAKELFFIFRDKTSGKETYGAGRYLYAEPPKDGTVVLDFNKAYSPPCAFTRYATCPLPPKQNRLPVRIEAGEKFAGHH